MPVNVTEPAAREIHRIILDQDLNPDKIRLRVGVKGGGCSGFSYLLDLTETQKDSDEMWEYAFAAPSPSAQAASASRSEAGGDSAATAVAQAGESFSIRVICDPKSYLYLNGTSIDFKDDGMLQKGFIFNNPNATSSCGCGSSFSA